MKKGDVGIADGSNMRKPSLAGATSEVGGLDVGFIIEAMMMSLLDPMPMIEMLRGWRGGLENTKGAQAEEVLQ